MKAIDGMQDKTKAEHIFALVQTFWPLQEKPDLDASEAVNMARNVAGLLYEAMDDAGLPLRHGFCLLVCATNTDKPVSLPLPSGENQGSFDASLARHIVAKSLKPIGIVVGLADFQKKGMLLHTHGFDNGERTQRLLSFIHTKIGLDFKKGKMTKARQN